MKNRHRADYCLGTVQFGLPYGINNSSGQPSRSDVFKILDLALDGGIRCLDTAAAYGESENVLGEYIRHRRCAEQVRLVSKLRPNFFDTIDNGTSLTTLVREEVEASLGRLGCETLDAYLLHRVSHLERPGMADALQEIRELGLVRKVGVSVYEPQDAMNVLDCGWMDAVQVPYNIVDRRLDVAGFFQGLNGREPRLTVYSRSALLQGLIMMKDDSIPVQLSGIKPYLRELDALLGRFGLNRFNGAVQFVLDAERVDFLVFGVETSAQLEGYLRLREDANELKECWAECLRSFQAIDPVLLSPHRWESLKREEGTT